MRLEINNYIYQIEIEYQFRSYGKKAVQIANFSIVVVYNWIASS